MIRKTLLVISLVLLVGTVGLWVRSYWAADVVKLGCGFGNRYQLSVASGDGSVCFHFAEYAYSDPKYVLQAKLPGGLRVKSLRQHPPPSPWRGGSFGCAVTSRGMPRSIRVWYAPRPMVLLASYAFILGAVAAVRRVRRSAERYRRRHDVCIKCAYDLTANASGVCPECGERISSSPRRLA